LAAIGQRIRELRLADGTGASRQMEFAKAIGITQGQLSKIEAGQAAASLDVLLRLRERYGRSVDWILTGSV